jgi:signal transduction histidine kinase
LSQVISNLIRNAIKFTTEGVILITTRKDNAEDDDDDNNDNTNNNQVIVSVKDTGSGIDPEILPRLFTKFATKSFEGTGLGLFISKSIIESHGGKIWAENNADGKGATFSFSIPITTSSSSSSSFKQKQKRKQQPNIKLVDYSYDNIR